MTACLPTTVNMCVALTGAAGGNVAAALANAVIGNVLGVFATPLLILALLSRRAATPPLAAVFVSMGWKVALPVALGQAARAAAPVRRGVAANAKAVKRLQEVALLSVVWSAFGQAFLGGFGVARRDLALLLAVLPLAHAAALGAGLGAFSRAFPPRDAVAAAFCASHKTLAFGLPLIKTLFAGDPDVAYYCAPIMILHPAQLLLGALAAPRIRRRLDERAAP